MKGLVIFRTGVPYIITTQHEKLILITFHSSFIARRNFITGIFIPLCYQKGIYAFLSLFILLDLFHKTIFHFPAHDLSKHKSPMCHTLVKLGGIRQSFEYISIYKIRHFKLQKKKKKKKKGWKDSRGKIIFYFDCQVLKPPVLNINVSVFQGHDCNSSAICGYQ